MVTKGNFKMMHIIDCAGLQLRSVSEDGRRLIVELLIVSIDTV